MVGHNENVITNEMSIAKEFGKIAQRATQVYCEYIVTIENLNLGIGVTEARVFLALTL
jgi:hypothetical protein